MNNQKKIFSLGIFFLFLLINSLSANAQKLRVEEVLAKHLESIGSPENRSAVRNYLFAGDAKFKTPYQGSPLVNGKIILASEDNKMLFNLGLNSLNYRQELINYDGKKSKIDFISPGTRSPLGAFLIGQESTIVNGLLGGVLFKSWTLLNSPETKARLTLDGTRKVNEVEYYVIDYNPRRGTDSTIKLYFDLQNFRHVRTEYKRVIPSRIGSTPDTSAHKGESRQILIEEFSNFKTVNNLTLPQDYQLLLTTDGQRGANQFQWKINISQFLFNQKFNPESFESSAN
jgi:hypothetical protein